MKQINFVSELPDSKSLMLINGNSLHVPLASKSVHDLT